MIRKIAGTLAALLITTAIMTSVSNRYGADKLRLRIKELQGQGERVLPSDFAPRLDRAPNAAADFAAAAAMLDQSGADSASVDCCPTTMPVNPKAWPHLQRAAARFKPALDFIDRAEHKPRCDWPHDLTSPVFENMQLRELNADRSLANLLRTAALVAHHSHDDAATVARLRQLVYLANVTDRSPALIAHLVAISISAGTTALAESLAPALRIGDEPGAASGADVRALADSLLDDSASVAGFQLAMDGERMTQVDLLASMARGAASKNFNVDAGTRYLSQSKIYADALYALDRSTHIAKIARTAHDWPAAKAALAAVPEVEGHLFVTDLIVSTRRACMTHFQGMTDRHLAGTALAIRLYQLDHSGQRPQHLNELVPTYLAAVPVDAMDAEGSAIRHVTRGDQPVLYSVGEDGIDDGGNEAPMPNAFGNIDEWRRLDRVYYLTGKIRATVYIPRPDQDGPGALPAPGYDWRAPWERDDTPPTTSQTPPAASGPPFYP
jgi:hypothetical protein